MTKPSFEVLAEERALPEGDPLLFAWHRARYERAATHARGKRVLDVGSGEGYGSALLAGVAEAVRGIDYSPAAVSHAAARYERANLAYEVLDVRDVGRLGDAAFDVITCFEVIEHIDEQEKLVRDLARLLTPGGVLYIFTPNARMERLHARAHGSGRSEYHIAPLTPRRLRALLRSAFPEVTLYGQAQDLGLRHLVLQSFDPLGLRLRLKPQRRELFRRAVARPAGGREPGFRFSRVLVHTAAVTFGECRVRAR